MTKFVNKQEKKQHVLDAALSLFTEKGYNAVTTREIAEKAGISKGGLYDYFENKEVLFEEVVINKMKNVLVDFKRQLLEKTDDPFERFQKIRDLSCTAHKPNKQRFFLLFDFYVTCNDEKKIERLLGNVYDLVREFIMQITYEAFPDVFEKKEDAKDYATIILSVLDGITIRHLISPERVKLSETISLFWEIITDTLQRLAEKKVVGTI